MVADAGGRRRIAIGLAAVVALSAGWPAAAQVASASASVRPPALPLVPSAGGGPFSAQAVPDDVLATGSMFVGFRGSDGQTVGTVATVSPWRAAFLKLGAEATPRSRDGAARLLWGLGFESPRDGTLFAHLHDWGPIRTARDFTLRHAELEAGYKLPRFCCGPVCLGATALARIRSSDGPHVGGRTTLTLGRRWYATLGLARSVPSFGATRRSPIWQLEYGLGRWDWRPGSLFVAYRDALSLARLADAEREPAWRQGNGIVTAGMTWAR